MPLAETHDEKLARLAREWFAELRVANATDERRDKAAEAARATKRPDSVDGDGGLLDWLFGDAEGDCDDGGDCSA